jgi:uncharacterized protein
MVGVCKSGQSGLSPTVLQRLQEVFTAFPAIERVILYGSRAKGNFRPSSDIDMTLVGEGLTSSDLAQIDAAIDDLLLPYQVDLSSFHQLRDPDLLAHIERAGCVLYERTRTPVE